MKTDHAVFYGENSNIRRKCETIREVMTEIAECVLSHLQYDDDSILKPDCFIVDNGVGVCCVYYNPYAMLDDLYRDDYAISRLLLNESDSLNIHAIWFANIKDKPNHILHWFNCSCVYEDEYWPFYWEPEGEINSLIIDSSKVWIAKDEMLSSIAFLVEK